MKIMKCLIRACCYCLKGISDSIEFFIIQPILTFLRCICMLALIIILALWYVYSNRKFYFAEFDRAYINNDIPTYIKNDTHLRTQ